MQASADGFDLARKIAEEFVTTWRMTAISTLCGRLVLLACAASLDHSQGGNAMATLKRIGPGSAFKVGLVTYAILGLVIGGCFAFFSMVAGSVGGLAGSQAGMGARMLGMGFGIGAIIIAPIFYGIIGGIGAALGALIYNLAAGWIGGLEVDIS
jgi:Transmembrane domain of unknown function (DUF3566)